MFSKTFETVKTMGISYRNMAFKEKALFILVLSIGQHFLNLKKCICLYICGTPIMLGMDVIVVREE